MNWITVVFSVLFACTIYIAFKKYQVRNTNQNVGSEVTEVDVWLQEQNLSHYKTLFREKAKFLSYILRGFRKMRWHEMAIDQAELEHKIDNLKKDASKAELLFEELLSLEKKAKGFGYGVWPLPWFYERLKKRWKKTSLEEISKVMAFNEEVNRAIATTRIKLDENTEAVSERDRNAEISLRVISLLTCAQLDSLPDVSLKDRERLHRASHSLQKQLILKKWLALNKIDKLYSSLLEVGVTSLEEIYSFESVGFEKFNEFDLSRLKEAREILLGTKDDLENLKLTLWNIVVEDNQSEEIWSWKNYGLLSSFVAGLFAIVVMAQPYFIPKAKPSLLQYVTGKYLQPSNCKVFFEWEDPKTVGETFVFTVKFYQRNGQAYPICNTDNLNVEVSEGTHRIATICQLGGCDPGQVNLARIKFTARRAGLYKIQVQVDGCHVRGSPFFKNFSSGPPDPAKTQLIKHSSIVVCTSGLTHSLTIEPRDEFNNLCLFTNQVLALQGYALRISKPDSDDKVPHDISFLYDQLNKRINVALKFTNEGCFHASVSLNGTRLCNGDFDIIVLSYANSELIQKNVARKNHDICYEARLLKIQSENLVKPKKVMCYISPKQVIIKEFLLKFIPKRLLTYRLCPSTKFYFHGDNNQYGWPTFAIDDGCQPRIELASSERDTIAATFSHFLLKNIGGSETFKDKQEFFYHEIRKCHQKHHHEKVQIKVYRDKLLDSSMKATKNFSVSDWCRNFEITFNGEQGLDWGGVRREWFSLVCSALFDARNGLFMAFSDSQQSLVHPNPKRPPNYKLKMFEFAGKIVGKCLFESALGGKFRQMVKARFTRSFLAQIIGLRIHHKYFEQDDPDLYLSKIKYIEEHDVDEMDLYFVEEEYCGAGQLTKTIDLIPNGSKVRVSNETKHQYLDCLAQYKLASTVKGEVDHFLKGLNELIPDSLLSIFDENELELLLCGTGEYDVADFRANHIVNGSSPEFRRVLEWFWAAVTNFTVEEMARLLQFTTGCSQLPPGGFQELVPKFTLTAAPTFGNLPTAHTCFNQLCLPGYDSYEQFEKALLLAIKEGTEGFGFI